jgi:hypothetical protein
MSQAEDKSGRLRKVQIISGVIVAVVAVLTLLLGPGVLRGDRKGSGPGPTPNPPTFSPEPSPVAPGEPTPRSSVGTLRLGTPGKSEDFTVTV